MLLIKLVPVFDTINYYKLRTEIMKLGKPNVCNVVLSFSSKAYEYGPPDYERLSPADINNVTIDIVFEIVLAISSYKVSKSISAVCCCKLNNHYKKPLRETNTLLHTRTQLTFKKTAKSRNSCIIVGLIVKSDLLQTIVLFTEILKT